MSIRLNGSRLATFALGLALTLFWGSSPVLAGKKGGGGNGGGGGETTTVSKPPTPTNFRVTAKTAYSITVAWDVAESTSDYSFHLSGTSQIAPAVLPKTARSHTFNALGPGNDYWLFIYTRDAAGNAGGQANLGPVVLPTDNTPPWTAPVVSVGEVGANYAHISWTRAEDDGPYHYSYELWLNGSLLYRSNYPRDTISTVLRFLQPDTDYTVQIRTIDIGSHPSPMSDPVAFRTLPVNPNDTTAPTVPTSVYAFSWGDLEMELSWEESTDDFDDAANIRYDVFANGRYEDVVFGSGGPRVIYGTAMGENLIEVFATDTSGNTSAAGIFRIFL